MRVLADNNKIYDIKEFTDKTDVKVEIDSAHLRKLLERLDVRERELKEAKAHIDKLSKKLDEVMEYRILNDRLTEIKEFCINQGYVNKATSEMVKELYDKYNYNKDDLNTIIKENKNHWSRKETKEDDN